MIAAYQRLGVDKWGTRDVDRTFEHAPLELGDQLVKAVIAACCKLNILETRVRRRTAVTGARCAHPELVFYLHGGEVISCLSSIHLSSGRTHLAFLIGFGCQL